LFYYSEPPYYHFWDYFFIHITNKAIAITVRTMFSDWSTNPEIKRNPKTVQNHAKILSESHISLFRLMFPQEPDLRFFPWVSWFFYAS